jgi:two-component system, NtrC family, nitrogen regulation sensor histidine kinase NtrY
VNRLRNRLIAAFLVATVIPLIATLWLTTSLLERSLSYAATEELDSLSKLLESTAREYYQQAKETLKAEASAGRVSSQTYQQPETTPWPSSVREFWESGEAERFDLSGAKGDHLDYFVRDGSGVQVYTRDLGNIRMEELSEQYSRSRELIEASRSRNLRRGLTLTLLVLMSAIWLVSLISLTYLASRFSKPIQTLTGGLSQLASGNLDVRLASNSDDETGRAIRAFNHMAQQLQESRERLVYLTQVASWQLLARKMAHELKNSLTPIRLTVEEIQARQTTGDRQFMDQAVHIVVNEIETLERRIRAFSEFSSEPSTNPVALDINGLLQERVSLLRPGHAGVRYDLRLSPEQPWAVADADQVKGILTNLLENAAEAAGPSGQVLAVTFVADGKVCVEVHDSGPGLSEEASRSLFEPTITFKKRGMGLGLSIARKSALVNGGDIIVVPGELEGAAFRVVLPRDS